METALDSDPRFVYPAGLADRAEQRLVRLGLAGRQYPHPHCPALVVPELPAA